MTKPEDADVSKDRDADHKAETGGEPARPGAKDRRIDADPALSPVAEQGGAAIANIGERRGSELFKDD